jgi:hypothetical protein
MICYVVYNYIHRLPKEYKKHREVLPIDCYSVFGSEKRQTFSGLFFGLFQKLRSRCGGILLDEKETVTVNELVYNFETD